MIVHFDSLNRFEAPKIYLCSPGSKIVDGAIAGVAGILTDTQDEELILNFNAISEFNFRLNYVKRDNAADTAFVYNLYRTTQNRRMIYLDDIGFFVITSIKDGYEDGQQYKDVCAQSCEVEIQNKNIPMIEDGTYQFRPLLEQIVRTIPGWTIGNIDGNVEALYRTFEDVSEDLNCLGFMMDNMQDAYECIFTFDCINRRIHVYDQNNYVEETSIHLTKEDLINSLEISENSDNLYTAIRVTGDEELNIAAVNPLGTSTIYNFDHYISWMSPELQNRLKEWKAAVNSELESYQSNNEEFYAKLEEQSNLQSEIDQLDTQLTMYTRCRENIVAESSTGDVPEYNTIIVNNGGTAITASQDIANTIAEIDSLIMTARNEQAYKTSELQSVTNRIAILSQHINAIRDYLSITNFFKIGDSTSLLDELTNYIFEGNYTDEYISVTSLMNYAEKFQQMKTLYRRAVSQLTKVSCPTQEFSVDVDNFLFAREFAYFSDQLHVGSLINVQLEEDDVAQLFLTCITVNYDDYSLSLTFGNRFNRFDPKSLFENALGSIQKSANTLNYVKELLYPIKSGEFNKMKEYIETSRTLTKDTALAATDQEVIIDDTGYTGRKINGGGGYDSRQVKLTHNILVFTDDAWDTCKVAIGEIAQPNGETAYGINTQYLIGDLIIGNRLQIKDNNGNDLMSVVDGKVATSVNAAIDGVQTSLSEIQQTADAVSIKISGFTDSNGNLMVDHVTTTTGYTFNSDGLRVCKSGDEIENLITNNGMYVNRGDDNMLTVDKDGVDAINITTRQYLVVGEHARFQNYGSDRTACFYIN
jgi:hypothetical protein